MRKKKKEKRIIKSIFEPVYRHEVIFFAGCSLEEANKYLKKWDVAFECPVDEEPAGMTAAFHESQSKFIQGTVFAVWIRERGNLYVLQHEIAHLCIAILVGSNIVINEHTSEAYAFYQEFWFRKLWELMVKK